MTLHIFVLICVVSVAHSAIIQYNTSVDCTIASPCKLEDADMWLGGIVPGPQDAARIYAPYASGGYFISSDNTTELDSISIENITLTVSANLHASMIASVDSNIVVNAGIYLYVSTAAVAGASNVTVNGDLLYEDLQNLGALVAFDTNTNLLINGGIHIAAAMINISGSITAAANSSVLLVSNAVYFAPREASINTFPYLFSAVIPDNFNILFPQGASFTSLEIGQNSNVTMYNRADIYNPISPGTLTIKEGASLNLVNVYVDVTISGDAITVPTGAGALNVDSSTLVFVNQDSSAAPCTSLSFSGNNKIFIFNAVVQDMTFADYNTYMELIANNLTLINNSSTVAFIPADVEVSGMNNLTLHGSFHFTGGLDVYSGAVNTINSTLLAFDGPIQLFGNTYNGKSYPSSLYLSGDLTAPNVMLYNSSSLNVVGTVRLKGDLLNQDGVLQLNDYTQNLFVNGNYVQGQNANISLQALDTASNASVSRLVVSGNASIAGNVLYSLSGSPKKHSRWGVLQTINGTISGSFAKKATAIAAGSIKTLDYEYTTNIVYVSYTGSSSPRKFGGLIWYYWVIIAAAAVLVLLMIVFFVVKNRKRKGYIPVAYSAKR